MFVSDLHPYTDEQIFQGLKRCREEIKPIKGFVTFNLAILIEKMGIPKGESLEHAEAEVQWELLNENIRFYDSEDTPGCYWVGQQPEQTMSPRGLAALRRIGGTHKLSQWAKREDWHFTKRDFIESFTRHEDVQYAAALVSGTVSRGRLTKLSDIAQSIPLPSEPSRG